MPQTRVHWRFLIRTIGLFGPNKSKQERDDLLWIRCGDNSCGVVIFVQRNQSKTETCKRSGLEKCFASAFYMKANLKQWGEELDFLESHLGDIIGLDPIRSRT